MDNIVRRTICLSIENLTAGRFQASFIRIAMPPADRHALRAARESNTLRTPRLAAQELHPRALPDPRAQYRKADRVVTQSASARQSVQQSRQSRRAAVRASAPFAKFFLATHPAPPEFPFRVSAAPPNTKSRRTLRPPQLATQFRRRAKSESSGTDVHPKNTRPVHPSSSLREAARPAPDCEESRAPSASIRKDSVLCGS